MIHSTSAAGEPFNPTMVTAIPRRAHSTEICATPVSPVSSVSLLPIHFQMQDTDLFRLRLEVLDTSEPNALGSTCEVDTTPTTYEYDM